MDVGADVVRDGEAVSKLSWRCKTRVRMLECNPWSEEAPGYAFQGISSRGRTTQAKTSASWMVLNRSKPAYRTDVAVRSRKIGALEACWCRGVRRDFMQEEEKTQLGLAVIESSNQ